MWRVSTAMDAEVERAVVEALRSGDPAAFDRVHDAFNVPLFTFLLHLSRRRDVAEDLLEETWLRLVRHARRLRAYQRARGRPEQRCAERGELTHGGTMNDER